MGLTFENVIIAGDEIEPGKLIWRRYRRPHPGMVEIFLDVNQHLAPYLAVSPYLPVGVAVLIPIDDDLIHGRPIPEPGTYLWGTDAEGAASVPDIYGGSGG